MATMIIFSVLHILCKKQENHFTTGTFFQVGRNVTKTYKIKRFY